MADADELLFDEKGNEIPAAPPASNDDDAGGAPAAGDDAAPAQGHDDDDDDEDARGTSGDNAQAATGDDADPEREAIRERRRLERQQKKQAQKEREDRLRREVMVERTARGQLEERLALLERRSSGMELTTLDNHIKQTADAYGYFKNQIAVASAAGDHAAVAEATEKMIAARERANHLNNIKQGYQRQQQQPTQPPLDPVVQNYGTEWMSRNNWYDPDRRDLDSDLVGRIDERMAAEGWNPRTKEYWEELDARVSKYLPHRGNRGIKNTQAGTPPRSRSPVSGSGRETGGGSSSGTTYRLSAERISALKEAGILPGTPDFVESMKRYHDYDKNHKAA